MNEVQVETTTMKAFGETIPRLVETVDIQILKSVHNKLVKPTLQPVQEGITGVTLHCLFPLFCYRPITSSLHIEGHIFYIR